MAKPRQFTLAILLVLASSTLSAEEDFDGKEQETGVFYSWGSTEGYNLFFTALGVNSYLIDNDGKELHKWKEPDSYIPGGISAYLTKKGTLLKAINPVEADEEAYDKDDDDQEYFSDLALAGGRVREYTNTDKCIWEFRYFRSLYRQVRDFVVLPNGNILAIAVETHSLAAAKSRGYKGQGQKNPEGYWSYTIVEVSRNGKVNPDFDPDGTDDEIANNTCETYSDETDLVWKWDSFDHISDYLKMEVWDIEKDFEISSIDFHPERDHILITCKPCGEIFVIDHKVDYTKVQFSDGQFIYRWGNPKNYGEEGTQLVDAEIAKWVIGKDGWDDIKSEGEIIIFNIDDPLDNDSSSAIVEIDTPYQNGKYKLENSNKTYGPKRYNYKLSKYQEMIEKEEKKDDKNGFYKNDRFELSWSSFYTPIAGFVQPLPNEGILFTLASTGETYELYKEERAIWKYVSPYVNKGISETLRGEDCEVAKDHEVTYCGSVLKCNAYYGMVKYPTDYEGVSALFTN